MSGDTSGLTSGGQGTFEQFETKVNETIKESTLSFNHQFDIFPKTINLPKQEKHIYGSQHYVHGKSVITISLKEAQKLISEKSGKGSAIGSNKERIDFGVIIGKYSDPITGKMESTTIGIIHYSKIGVHIVPARPKKEVK